MTITPERLATLDQLTLKKGNHRSFNEGVCLMEAVAWVAGEAHTDQPQCAAPILGAFGRSLNDVLPGDKRQRLVPLVPRIVGTADDGLDQARGLMAADWLIRTYTPTWLRLAGLEESAVSLETLPGQASWDDVEAAAPVVRAARKRAAAAWVAARVDAGDAAGVAAWDAARVAAWDAAWVDARDAAGVAARDAAGVDAGDAAGVAAWDAARDALAPTVDALQDSAINLFDRMIEVAP